MTISKPIVENLSDYLKNYIELVHESDLILALEKNRDEIRSYYFTIPENKGDYSYAVNKWTNKEVLCHIIDAERIFSYRALRFSRNDKTELSGYDDDFLVANSNTVNRSISDLLDEFISVRNSTISLFKSMNLNMLNFVGKANNNVISVSTLGWLIAGHSKHHLSVLLTKYKVSN